MRVISFFLAVLMAGFSFSAAARDDVMPPPKNAPRIPVERQLLAEAKEYEGAAQAIDGERLMIEGKEIRLFGIVTPALTSNYGPKSRQQLDRMLQGNVLCKVTDRDREGRPVAFCGTVGVPDISYEMLRQGWAMADRKALKGNGLDEIYGKVEEEAQAANRGIFAPAPMATVIPLTNPGNSVTVPVPADQPEKAMGASQPASTEQATPVADVTPVMAAPVKAAQEAPVLSEGISFVERYQVILAAFFLFMAACIYASVPGFREKARLRETRRSVAAAIRGELMAARHICRTKARELLRFKKADGPNLRPSQLWPRIRTIVYQANVSSIGLLGSEMARRVASVYGQCIDYAAFFQQAPVANVPAPKAVSETLTILADHMDVVLDGLAQVEESGRPFVIEATDYTMLAAPAAEQEEIEEETQEKKPRQGLKAITQSVASIFGKSGKADEELDDAASEEEADDDTAEEKAA